MPRRNAGPRARTWCFTINNPGGWTLPDDWEEKGIRGCVFQTEIAPETGTEHLQGYVEFKKPMYTDQIKRAFDCNRMHLEVRRGTRKEAYDYCVDPDKRKPGTEPLIFGEFKFEEGGAAWKDLHEKVKAGASYMEICDWSPAMAYRYKRSIEENIGEVRDKRLKIDEREVTVITYWGSPRTGKSRRATWEAKQFLKDNGIDEIPYRKDPGSNWWDNYKGEKCVIIDDVDHNDIIPLRNFLRVLDRYPLQVQTKGGHSWAGWTRVWITSNEDPREWYPKHNMAWGPEHPLYRRLAQENGSHIDQMEVAWLPQDNPILETMEILRLTPIEEDANIVGVEPSLFRTDPPEALNIDQAIREWRNEAPACTHDECQGSGFCWYAESE